MTKLDICTNCYNKASTKCINCKIRTPIDKLNKFIDDHKSNLSQFILYINEDYSFNIINNLKSNLDDIYDIRTTNMLESNTVFVIVDRKLFDWGDIGVDFGKTGGDL